MDYRQTSTYMLLDELSEFFENPYVYPGKQYRNRNSFHDEFLDQISQPMFAGSDNVFQETSYGANPRSDFQFPTTSVHNSCDFGRPVPSAPMAPPQGTNPNFLEPSPPFFQGSHASGIQSFRTTSVQEPMFQAPKQNAHQFDNQSMSLGTQQLSPMEILRTSDTQFIKTAQASDPGKAGGVRPDIKPLPVLSLDVLSYLGSLSEQDVETPQPQYGHQPSAMMTSNAGAAFNPLPRYEQQYDRGYPQRFPAPTPPFQSLQPAQFSCAPSAIPGPASSNPILANALLQQVSLPERQNTRGVKRPVPDEEKDEEYAERRRNNNLAAKRSRELRKQKEEENVMYLRQLEREQVYLCNQVQAMKQEVFSLSMSIACKENVNHVFHASHNFASEKGKMFFSNQSFPRE